MGSTGVRILNLLKVLLRSRVCDLSFCFVLLCFICYSRVILIQQEVNYSYDYDCSLYFDMENNV